jgi:hypothetical protein
MTWKLLIIALESKFRRKAVHLHDIYALALSEMSKAVGKRPPPGATLSERAGAMRRLLPDASAILQAPASGYNVENPLEIISWVEHALETGVERQFAVAARPVQHLDEILADDSLAPSQKDKIIQLGVELYLLGWLAPVIQMDRFSERLDELVVKTRKEAYEELLLKILSEKIKSHSSDDILECMVEILQKAIQATDSKSKLTLKEKAAIINRAFSRLSDIGIKSSFTTRTIQNWDNGKCPYEGYSSFFNEIELIAWCNKTVGALRGKQALHNVTHGMSDEEMSRKARKF